MFTSDSIPGFLMGLREGLEALLIVTILIKVLVSTNRENDKKYVKKGFVIGLIISIVFGGIMFQVSKVLESGTSIAKLWESLLSFVAVILISGFIIQMIKHRKTLVTSIKNATMNAFTPSSLILLTTILVAREGAEVVLFVFTAVDHIPYFTGAITGILSAVLLVYVFYKSLINVQINKILTLTLLYLILQAGFLLGYGLHEFLSYLKDAAQLSKDSFLFIKAFDLSSTVLNHKEGSIGIILYAIFGWYSKPEVIQFIVQYGYTIWMLFLFRKSK